MTDEREAQSPPVGDAVAPTPPQPAVGWAPPPAPPVAVAGRRTTLSLVAGIILVLLGVLGTIASLAVLTIGRAFINQFDFGSMPGLQGLRDPNSFVESALMFGGIFVLVCSTFYIVGGVGILRSAGWGRVIGIVIGILAGLVWLGSLTGGNAAGRGDLSFAIVLLVAHAYVAVALLFFWKTKTAAT